MRKSIKISEAKQLIIQQQAASPSRKFVLETKNSWCPNAAPVRSPNRGTRTYDMKQSIPVILHSENANQFDQTWQGKMQNGASTITLGQNTDLTLTHIEAGFQPQKMCSRLQSLGVLVLDEYQPKHHPQKTLHQKLATTAKMRSLPLTQFNPRTIDILNFLPPSFSSLSSEKTPFLTDSLARSSAAASISNARLSDSIPIANIPGSEISSVTSVLKRYKFSEIQVPLNREKKNRVWGDNPIYKRLGEFEDRNNKADRCCAEIISGLCVPSDKIDIQILQRLKNTIQRSFKEDFDVSEHLHQVWDNLDRGIIPKIEGISFDNNVQDENIRICVKLIQNGIVLKLKSHLITLNALTQSDIYIQIFEVCILLCLLGPSIRDAFYVFFESLILQEMPIIFNSKFIQIDRVLVLNLAILSRINYAVCSQLLNLSIKKIKQNMLTMEGRKKENLSENSSFSDNKDSSLQNIIKNSLAKETQFSAETDALTLNINTKQQDKIAKQMIVSYSDDLYQFLLFLAQHCIFGILQNIMIFQQQIKAKKAIIKSETEIAQNMVQSLQQQLGELFVILDTLKPCELILKEEELYYIHKLNSLSDNGIYLCDELVDVKVNDSEYIQKLLEIMKNLFSE
ncbi:hypothetical protein SS50377_22096 [Spironucleus salmonicida]|uniref:Uncharacterized protein n=1 Tax=Spironucleus salmonicida TaxID=348837 RepID=V6LM30_9EUKA|nr:hypothetical protein SS50377_22096 [Spironucleus salmonicida]|eukprot:EST45742.1 Hypothetical protein SS50377_14313 [Spironucleus salmonicida]